MLSGKISMVIRKVCVGDRVFGNIKDCCGLRSLTGLMFDNKSEGALIHGYGKKISIWMPFVLHELDLFFLDENFNVMKTEKAVPMTINPKTWKIYSCRNAKYCMEIKSNLLNGVNIKNIEICR